MKISMSTGTLLHRYSPDIAFGMMKEAGFDSVDLGMNLDLSYDDIVRGNLAGTVYAKSIREVRDYFAPQMAALKANGLSVAQAHTPFPLYTRSEETNRFVRETAAKCIVMCGEMGCPYLIVHPCFGDYSWRLTAEEQWEANKALYLYLLPYAREHGVGICLENMFTVYRGRIIGAACSDITEAITYIDRLNDIAGEKIYSFCYDTGHQMLLGHDLKQDLLRLGGDRVTALHMHDNDGRDDMHMPAYMGRGDWNAILEGLKAIRFNGTLNFETGPGAFPEQLWPQAMKLICDTGRLFAQQLA